MPYKYAKVERERRKWRWDHDAEYRARRAATNAKWLHKQPLAYQILVRARNRAKQKRLPFNLTIEDIIVPKLCPILKTKLKPGKGRTPADNAPSLDRLIPEKGYVRGNVCVISQRANRMKATSTLAELKSLVQYMERRS